MRRMLRLTNWLVEEKIIPEEEKEIVCYGLENLTSNLLGVMLILAVGILLGHTAEGLILAVTVLPLRKNAGGYHAKTRTRCFLVSAALLVISTGIFFVFRWSKKVYLTVALLSTIIVFLLAPVGNENKRLDEEEHRVYRRRTRIILFVEMAIFLIAYIAGWESLFKAISCSFFIVAVSLIAGKVIEERRSL